MWRNGGGVAGADPLPDKALKERFCRSAAGDKARWEGIPRDHAVLVGTTAWLPEAFAGAGEITERGFIAWYDWRRFIGGFLTGRRYEKQKKALPSDRLFIPLAIVCEIINVLTA